MVLPEAHAADHFAPEQPPRVWILLGQGAGGNAQMLYLARSLGWPFETRQLAFNPLNLLPNTWIGAQAWTLDRRRSTPLGPPWPDLVIAASRRSTPVARWIRKQSGGRTRLVHLFHAMAPLEWFDLVITTPQYCLPPGTNVLEIAAPLNRVDPSLIREAADRWRPRLVDLPRPWTTLLVGGNSSRYLLDAGTASRMGREYSSRIGASGGSLLITTSPRTPRATTQALLSAVTCPAWRHAWQPGAAENPYLAFLGLADSFVVTADSASMLLEASLTGKPVEIFDWPARPAQRWGLPALLRRLSGNGQASWYRRLVARGYIKPPRDFERLRAAIQSRAAKAQWDDDMDAAVRAIHALFPGRGHPPRASGKAAP